MTNAHLHTFMACCWPKPTRKRTHEQPTLEPTIATTALVGYAAGTLSMVSYVPQVIRVWRTRQTRDLSYGMFALLVTASALWVGYGILSHQWPVIIPNTGCLVLSLAILIGKFAYG
ncbi:MAG: SemiSWEET transporter [Gemmatimonadota bacterium]|nr:SemiSWEET transporter [Gemmatimonadota bacterium]